jgi:hypothetical protein
MDMLTNAQTTDLPGHSNVGGAHPSAAVVATTRSTETSVGGRAPGAADPDLSSALHIGTTTGGEPKTIRADLGPADSTSVGGS